MPAADGELLEWFVDFECFSMRITPCPPPTCETSLKVDLAEPAVRYALNIARAGGGSWRWTHGDAEVASVGYVWSGSCRRLTISWLHAGVQRSQTIQLVCSAPYFGGMRLWFLCPISGARVRALFLAADGRWASRRALGLAYASQRVGRVQQAFNRLLHSVERGERRNAVRRIARHQRRSR